jgi:hypothetical protein
MPAYARWAQRSSTDVNLVLGNPDAAFDFGHPGEPARSAPTVAPH